MGLLFGSLIIGIPLRLSAGASIGIGFVHGCGGVEGNAGILGRQLQLRSGQVDDHIFGGIYIAEGFIQGIDGILFAHTAYVYVGNIDVVQDFPAIGVPRAADEQGNHKHNQHQ